MKTIPEILIFIDVIGLRQKVSNFQIHKEYLNPTIAAL